MRISDWSSDVCSSDLFGQFLVCDDHGFARKRDEIFRHVATCYVRITRNMSPKIATHASAILSQSAIGKRRASNELSTNANAPANHSDWTTVSPFIARLPHRHSPVRHTVAIGHHGLHNPLVLSISLYLPV